MATPARKVAVRMGRPKKTESETLQAYGLHLSRDAVKRMTKIKELRGFKSVRDWLEQMIAYEYDEIFNGRESAGELRAVIEEQRVALAKLEDVKKRNAELTRELKNVRQKLMRALRGSQARRR
jgi:SMC interacting uncharacterized protein involved in chromosome segregation